LSPETHARFLQRLAVSVPGLLMAIGCAFIPAGAPSPLNPQTEAAGQIAQLGWVMIAVATVVCLIVFAALAGGLYRPRTPLRPGAVDSGGDSAAEDAGGNRVVVIGGMVLPALVSYSPWAIRSSRCRRWRDLAGQVRRWSRWREAVATMVGPRRRSPGV